ncbi:hypothetical protein EV401DRAFT_1896216 [Pisolithus croceorrhizus]|nr:hypothetical protein EV401DRAFT_1896216 [Pisolithus croceorrhizus]
MTVSLWVVQSPVSIVVQCLCECINELRDSLVLFYHSWGILAWMEDREDRIIDPCGVLTCRQPRCFLRVFQPHYRTSHNSIWKIVLELEVVEPRTMVMKTHTILIPGGSGKEYTEKKPKAQVTKPFLGCALCTLLVTTRCAVTGDISTCGGMTVLNTYEVWCPIPQHHVRIARRRLTTDNSAILEVCVHAAGDDKHGSALTVTGDVST